jgi:hypothetical protein
MSHTDTLQAASIARSTAASDICDEHDPGKVALGAFEPRSDLGAAGRESNVQDRRVFVHQAPSGIGCGKHDQSAGIHRIPAEPRGIAIAVTGGASRRSCGPWTRST